MGIEQIVLDCKVCKEPTTHLYLGNYGVEWKPAHLYSCLICHNKYKSLVEFDVDDPKYKLGRDNK